MKKEGKLIQHHSHKLIIMFISIPKLSNPQILKPQNKP